MTYCTTRSSVSEIRLNTTCEAHRLAFHTCLFPRLPVLQFGASRFPVPRFQPDPLDFTDTNRLVYTAERTNCTVYFCIQMTILAWAFSFRAKLLTRRKAEAHESTVRVDSVGRQCWLVCLGLKSTSDWFCDSNFAQHLFGDLYVVVLVSVFCEALLVFRLKLRAIMFSRERKSRTPGMCFVRTPYICQNHVHIVL